MDKKAARIKRARRTRAKIQELGEHRLTVFRTPRHIYAQIIEPAGSKIVASASTLDAQVKEALAQSDVKHSGNAAAASIVGKFIAERAKAAGINKVAFDRAGFKYHGRIKSLADAARENGIQF